MKFQIFLFLISFSFFSSQILTSPRDEPIIFSSNIGTTCCHLRNDFKALFLCLNQTNSKTNSNTNAREKGNKIVLVSYLTQSILSYGAFSTAINSIYSKQNNYFFSIHTPETGSEYFKEDQRWNKVKILQEAINPKTGWARDSEYLVWLDSDLIFLDLGMKIEEIGLEYPRSHVIMSEDVDLSLGIANTGFILVKNSEWSYNFLSAWWNNYNKSLGMDQYVLSKVYHDKKEEEGEDYQHCIKILPIDALNSNFPAWLNQLPSNQILHLAGANKQTREVTFQLGFENICNNINNNNDNNDNNIDNNEQQQQEQEDNNNTNNNNKNKKNKELKIIPRQLGLSREVLAQIDSSLPRAKLLNQTLIKIKKSQSMKLNASTIINVSISYHITDQ